MNRFPFHCEVCGLHGSVPETGRPILHECVPGRFLRAGGAGTATLGRATAQPPRPCGCDALRAAMNAEVPGLGDLVAELLEPLAAAIDEVLVGE